VAYRTEATPVSEIEVSAIVRRIGVATELEPQIPERLINRQRARNADHGAVGKALRFRGVSVLEQSPNLGDCVLSVWIATIALFARPDGVFVQLKTLSAEIAENHRGQPAIPYRKGLCPTPGRLAIPEFEGIPVIAECRHTKREGKGGDQQQSRSQSVVPVD
jgi:hypothetical protein